jgi:hypothetical protein
LRSDFVVRKTFGFAPTRLILLASLLLTSAGAAQDGEENKPLLQRSQAVGSWLLEMSRDGGMRPSRQILNINSDGELAVLTEHRAAGALVVDCSVKMRLSAEDFRKIKEAVQSAQPGGWRVKGYSDEKHPVCCDQPTTRLKLESREALDLFHVANTSWYPGSSELRPADLVKLAEAAEELWNKARGRCEAGEANE